MNVLPVLNYHGIESRKSEYGWEECELPYVLDRVRFQEQLALFKQMNYESAGLSMLEKWVSSAGTPQASVLLTFDDGHRSHFDHVFPLLKQHGMKGIFFVSAGWIGKQEYMGDKELRILLEEGFVIGSHGYSHVPLKGLSRKALEREICDSKKALEDLIRFEVASFSIPRGYYSAEIITVAKKAGYKFVFTSHFGVNHLNRTDPFYIRRMAVTPEVGTEQLRKMIRGALGTRLAMESCKEGLRRLLGPAFYDKAALLKAKVKNSGKGRP